MGSILWGAPYGGINTFPRSLVELNYANFNVISHCEIHRGHQENQRYSFSSQNFSRKRLCKQFHAELGGQGNPDRPVQPLSCCTDTGQPKNSDQITDRLSCAKIWANSRESTDRIQTPDSLFTKN